jgi:hypothetical protein
VPTGAMEATTSSLATALRGTPFLVLGVGFLALAARAMRMRREDLPRKSWLAMGVAAVAFGVCFEVKAATGYSPNVVANMSRTVFVVIMAALGVRGLGKWRDRRRTAAKT